MCVLYKQDLSPCFLFFFVLLLFLKQILYDVERSEEKSQLVRCLCNISMSDRPYFSICFACGVLFPVPLTWSDWHYTQKFKGKGIVLKFNDQFQIRG